MRGSGFSYWPTPTTSNNGNWPDLIIDGGRITFRNDPAMAKMLGLIGCAKVWSMAWSLMKAGAASLRDCPACSPRVRVHLRTGRDGSMPIRDLNPRFTEALMGWPTGWTDPLSPVTGYAAWLQHMRTELSTLPWPGEVE